MSFWDSGSPSQQNFCRNYAEIMQNIMQKKNYAEILQKLCRSYAENSAEILQKFCWLGDPHPVFGANVQLKVLFCKISLAKVFKG